MEIRKPKRVSLSAQIVQEMERLISTSQWKVGERIPPEPELMQLFGVSRNTVREAMQSLIHAGLLASRPGDGTYVNGRSRFEILISNELSDSEFEQIFEARVALETGIVELAAQNRTFDDLVALKKKLERRNATGDQLDDAIFHMEVAKTTHNPLLSRFYNEICLYMSKHMADKPFTNEERTREIAVHNTLFDALAASNSVRAKEITREILDLYYHRFLKESAPILNESVPTLPEAASVSES